MEGSMTNHEDLKLTELHDDYQKNGYVIIKGAISHDKLSKLEQEFRDILSMQLDKLCVEHSMDESTDSLVAKVDNVSYQALHACCVMLKHTKAAYELMSDEAICAASKAVIGAKSPLVMSGPSLFVNQPNKSTRKYTAHAEQNWYPKRRNFVNVWLPFIHPRKSEETMKIWQGSHQQDWFYFTEYTGYGDSREKLDNVQYEIPAKMLKDYKEEALPGFELGDVIFFMPQLVHSSVDLDKDKTGYAITIRAFDYAEDLTLSATWSEVPYAGDKSSSLRLFDK